MRVVVLSILFAACCYNSFSQSTNSKPFSIKGKYLGKEITEISCSYRNEFDKWVTKDCEIINGRFSLNGSINGPSEMSISSKLANGRDEINAIDILIEPGNMEISLKENEFKSIKVEGSSIQQKYNSLEKSKLPIYTRLQSKSHSLDAFDSIGYFYKMDDTIRFNQLLEKRKPILAQMDQIRDSLNQINMNYVVAHPNEFLSAYLLQWQYLAYHLNKDTAKFYCINFSEPVQNSYWTKSILRDINIKEGSVIGATAKDFTVKDMDGLDVSFSPSKNNGYVILDFWASWCVPCRKSFPHLKLVYNKYKASGLSIMAISNDLDKEAWLKAIKHDSIENWKNLRSVASKDDVLAETDIALKYEINPIPMYYLINKEGVIVGRWMGEDDEIEKEIDKKLQEIFGF